MKKLLVIFMVFSIVLCVNAFASTNKPLQNIGKGLDEIAYGTVEIPDSISETNTKGSPAYSKTTEATNSDVGRGIARFVGGVWKIATFWYPQD